MRICCETLSRTQLNMQVGKRPLKLLVVWWVFSLIGCVSMYSEATFSEWRGELIEGTGTGGTVRNINGIDVWKTGEPNRKCRLIGVLENHFSLNMWSYEHMHKEKIDNYLAKHARKNGGDAIIYFEPSQSTFLGVQGLGSSFGAMRSNTTASANGSASAVSAGRFASAVGSASGSSQTTAFSSGTSMSSAYQHSDVYTRVLVVKYLD